VLGLIIAETFLRTGFPVYLGLLWFIVFPVSVAYGIVKKELFDIRHLARSSVVLRRRDARHHGPLRAARRRVRTPRWSASTGTRSPQFTLVFPSRSWR
jgi:hypothetical protein